MTWLNDIYRQHRNMLAPRLTASNTLVNLRSRLSDMVQFISGLLTDAGTGNHSSVRGAGQRLMDSLHAAYTGDATRLIASADQAQFDAVYGVSAPVIDVDREVEILRNCDWVKRVTLDNEALTVLTADVQISHDGFDYDLGQFTLSIARNKLTGVLDGSRDALHALTIEGPRKYEIEGSYYYHPHVPCSRESEPCLGAAGAPFERNVECGLLSDAFLVLWAFLNTYNHESPMCEIDVFADASGGGTAAPAAALSAQLYECPSCGMSVPLSDKRESDGKYHCAKCDDRVGAERALGRTGDWKCFNCESDWTSTERPALTRRGVKVCARCVDVNLEPGEVRVRHTTHWNGERLLCGVTSVGRLFELLRPSSFGVERFSDRSGAVAVPSATTDIHCSCGNRAFPAQACLLVPGASVCADCDPEHLGVSEHAYHHENIASFVDNQFSALVPADVRNRIERVRRPGAPTLLQNIGKLSGAQQVNLLKAIRRVITGSVERPPLDVPITYWIAWINSLVTRLPDGQPTQSLIEV